MFWFVCILFLTIPSLLALATYGILMMAESMHMRKLISGIPWQIRLMLLKEIQNAKGNFSMVTNLKQHIREDKFGKGVDKLLVRALRERELVCDGNGPKELNVTSNVPPEFANASLDIIKSEDYIKTSADKSPLQSSEEETLKEIVKKYFGGSYDNAEVFEKKVRSLRKTFDGLNIVVTKNTPKKKVGVTCAQANK